MFKYEDMQTIRYREPAADMYTHIQTDLMEIPWVNVVMRPKMCGRGQ